eukprot:6208887-Pleurochrysis_carterae.AAC.6
MSANYALRLAVFWLGGETSEEHRWIQPACVQIVQCEAVDTQVLTLLRRTFLSKRRICQRVVGATLYVTQILRIGARGTSCKSAQLETVWSCSFVHSFVATRTLSRWSTEAWVPRSLVSALIFCMK